MFRIVFSSSLGSGMVSTGYVAGAVASRREAETIISRLREEDAGEDNVRTEYYVLGQDDHECSIPGWDGACRQCRKEG